VKSAVNGLVWEPTESMLKSLYKEGGFTPCDKDGAPVRIEDYGERK
jgi:hypothetical protein